MHHNLILRVVAALLCPAIFLFAFYVQFHGDLSPGGGFQAGAIFATGLILYGLVFGILTLRKIFSLPQLQIAMAVGILLFAGTGIAGILLGGTFLDYAPLGASARSGRHLGIFLVELGVGITVAASFAAIFFSFSSYTPSGTPSHQERKTDEGDEA